MALFLDAAHNGKPTRIAPKNGHHFELPELQRLVGGYIEVVPVATVEGIDLYLVLNEDGKRAPHIVNTFATSLLHDAGGMADDYVAGNAVMCTRAEMNEDDEGEPSTVDAVITFRERIDDDDTAHDPDRD